MADVEVRGGGDVVVVMACAGRGADGADDCAGEG